MVQYRTWVSIVFEVAKTKGLDTSKTENNTEVLSIAADIWQERKTELKNASEASARSIADSEISIS